MSCILTLALDEISQRRFEELRRAHFPSELNQIPAHLTLFHALPEREETVSSLKSIAARQPAFAMRVSQVKSIGRGVAFFFEASPAQAVHRQLSASFEEHLSNQDRQGFRPHVVVQNKITPAHAQATLLQLQAAFQPWSSEAVGLDLWRYLNGPWQHLRRFDFTP